MRKIFLALTATVFLGFGSGAGTWDGIITGNIGRVDVAAGDNYGFRVSLDPAVSMCGNANTWAYINESDSNYKVYVSTLLSASLADKQVTIHSTIGQGDYCQIGFLTVNLSN